MLVGSINKIPGTWLVKPPFLRAKPAFADDNSSLAHSSIDTHISFGNQPRSAGKSLVHGGLLWIFNCHV